MQDVLQKKMPDLCSSLPQIFMTNACGEFMSKDVFYAAIDDISRLWKKRSQSLRFLRH
jgi:hypothetical protein